jgi:hypothetical protein
MIAADITGTDSHASLRRRLGRRTDWAGVRLAYHGCVPTVLRPSRRARLCGGPSAANPRCPDLLTIAHGRPWRTPPRFSSPASIGGGTAVVDALGVHAQSWSPGQGSPLYGSPPRHQWLGPEIA